MTRSPDSSCRDHGERPQGHRCVWVEGQAPLTAQVHPLGCFQALPTPQPLSTLQPRPFPAPF